MQTFDRLKIVSDLNSIFITDERQFEKTEKNGVLFSMKFYQKSPNLMIKVDYENQEVTVEFTGKILGNRYPELISLQTIEQCFRNIESLGFCKFNIALIMEGEVVSCDVTKDIMYGEVAKIHTYIQSHISNFNRYICRAFKNGNLVIEKNVTTKKIKKRMTIYNKETEMSQSANRKFVEDNALEEPYIRAFCIRESDN